MRTISSVPLVLLVGTFACSSPSTDETSTTTDDALVSRVNGSATGSTYADPSATYLSVRRIDTLTTLGALPGVLGSVANRVDGIIANQPADGRISLKELVEMEQANILKTLFPEEQAALPKLWEIMKTASGAPIFAPSPSPLPTIQVTDRSTPAGLTPPARLDIASLPTELQTPARRVELTYDDDGNGATIAPSDLASALANRSPYTPQDIAAFQKIQQLFHDRATSSIRTTADLSVAPYTASTTLGTFGAVTLRVDDRVAYTETRSLWLSNPNYPEGALDRYLTGTADRAVRLAATGDVKVVVIQESAETEAILDPANVALPGGRVTLEVWSNGTRLSSQYVSFASDIATHTDRVDLKAWVDYELTAGGAPLAKNVVSASVRGVYNAGSSYDATYSYDVTAAPVPSDASSEALSLLKTPTNVLPGHYDIPVPGRGTFGLDVSPSGVVWATRPTGQKQRADVHVWGTQAEFDTDYPDMYRVLLNPGTNEIEFFQDGRSTDFDGPLSPSYRNG